MGWNEFEGGEDFAPIKNVLDEIRRNQTNNRHVNDVANKYNLDFNRYNISRLQLAIVCNFIDFASFYCLFSALAEPSLLARV